MRQLNIYAVLALVAILSTMFGNSAMANQPGFDLEEAADLIVDFKAAKAHDTDKPSRDKKHIVGTTLYVHKDNYLKDIVITQSPNSFTTKLEKNKEYRLYLHKYDDSDEYYIIGVAGIEGVKYENK